MSKRRYVIYLWETLSLGSITCARPFVDQDSMLRFIEYIKQHDGYQLLEIAEPVITIKQPAGRE